MATATKTPTKSRSTSTSRNARATKAGAKATARNASATAKSARSTAKASTSKASTSTSTSTSKARTTTRREIRKADAGVSKHSRRVLGAAQAEVAAVAAQPTRPLLFTLGVVDRVTAGVRAVPSTLSSTVVSAPARTRGRIVEVFATAGDLAEKAQQGYTEVAKDGEQLVRSVRRQESTQRAVKLADRAQTRAGRSVSDAEKAAEAGSQAAAEAVSKLG